MPPGFSSLFSLDAPCFSSLFFSPDTQERAALGLAKMATSKMAKGKKGSAAQIRAGKALATTSKTTPEILQSLRVPKPIGEPSATHEWVWDSSSPFVEKLPQTSTEVEGTTRKTDNQSFGSVKSFGNCELAQRLVAINKRQEVKIDALEVCNNALIDQIEDVATKYCVLGVENAASKSQNKQLKIIVICMILCGFMYFMSEYMCQG